MFTVRRTNVVGVAGLPKMSCRVNAFPSHSSVETDELIPKVTWNRRGPRRTKTILKKNRVGFTPLNFKTYHKAIVIETVKWT